MGRCIFERSVDICNPRVDDSRQSFREIKCKGQRSSNRGDRAQADHIEPPISPQPMTVTLDSTTAASLDDLSTKRCRYDPAAIHENLELIEGQ